MRVTYITYPWAFETPGGGEIQLLKYEQHLRGRSDLDIARHNPWADGLGSSDVVHFFSCMGGSVHFCRYVKARGLPLIISASLWITEGSRSLYPVEEIRAQLSCADVIVTNGDIESDQIASVIGIDRSRFATVRNGCDASFLEPVDSKLFRERFNIEGAFVLCVANIEPRKNQLTLIRAARATQIPVVFIGRVRDRAYADACWREAGTDARYVGSIEHDDPLLRSAFNACSVFCLPSTLETPGLAAIEAAAAGARLVITREGSTKEYFAEHAMYVDPNDTADVADKLGRALLVPPSQYLRSRVATRYTWEHAVTPLVPIYLSLARSHGPARSDIPPP